MNSGRATACSSATMRRPTVAGLDPSSAAAADSPPPRATRMKTFRSSQSMLFIPEKYRTGLIGSIGEMSHYVLRYRNKDGDRMMEQMLGWGLFHWQLSRLRLNRPPSEDEFYGRDIHA